MLGRKGVTEGPQNSSVVDQDSMGSLDPYPDPDSQSGSRREKKPTNIQKDNKFHF